AACVMDAALQAVGYRTRLLGRCDLDPKATLPSAHSIVEVTGSDGMKYIVDPAYLQFFQDVYMTDEALPTDPVLVLEEDEVADFVEKSIMARWTQTFKLVEKNNQKVLFKLKAN